MLLCRVFLMQYSPQMKLHPPPFEMGFQQKSHGFSVFYGGGDPGSKGGDLVTRGLASHLGTALCLPYAMTVKILFKDLSLTPFHI